MLRTEGIESGLWATPQAHDTAPGNPERVGRFGTEHGGRNLNDEAAMWPTPHGFSQDGKTNGPSGNEPGRAVNRSLWPTPQPADGSGGGQAARYLTPERSNDLNDAVNHTNGSGSLNPEWVEWLMGFPAGWTALEPSGMPSSRKSRK